MLMRRVLETLVSKIVDKSRYTVRHESNKYRYPNPSRQTNAYENNTTKILCVLIAYFPSRRCPWLWTCRRQPGGWRRRGRAEFDRDGVRQQRRRPANGGHVLTRHVKQAWARQTIRSGTAGGRVHQAAAAGARQQHVRRAPAPPATAPATVPTTVLRCTAPEPCRRSQASVEQSSPPLVAQVRSPHYYVR